MTRALLALALFGPFTACGDTEGRIADGGSTEDGSELLPLEDCATGLWLEPLVIDIGCSCPADSGSNGWTPECAEPDCVQHDFLLLSSGGDGARFELRRSAARSTLSMPAPELMLMLRFRWHVEDAAILETRPLDGRTVMRRTLCDTSTLSLDSQTVERAPTGVAEAVGEDLDRAGWIEIPYTPE